MDKLVVAEKPSVALRIASSIGEGSQKRNVINGVSYYEIYKNGERIYVVAAVGHLFTLRQRSNERGFPIYDIEWAPSYTVNKQAYFTKKYLNVIEEIGKKCNYFINACDYDIEGTVIGTNIIRFIASKGDANARPETLNIKRMRFSTTTAEDLLKSYSNLEDFDKGNFDAGIARHTLDWLWGINLSRVLMHMALVGGRKMVLSIGRVQGPTLALLARREEEIKNFRPVPYWKVSLKAKGTVFYHIAGEIFEKEKADYILSECRGKEGIIEKVESEERKARPYPPFDLTSLQLEANRVFRMDPSRTLSVAQSLYERAYISYPRTSSQKLPQILNLPRIIGMLAKNPEYAELANMLIRERRYSPAEGPKEDEAHPAIFPTGVQPTGLTEEERKIYDLIVRRFLSTFGAYATLVKTKVTISVGGERFYAEAEKVTSKGWIEIYAKYANIKMEEMQSFSVGERIKPEGMKVEELKTKPPNRFTKASLIAVLEKKGLGTKATRTAIIDTLYKRGYISGSSIVVTEFGMSVYNVLKQYGPEILDEEMTRKLERDMDSIARGSMEKEKVIDEGKAMISEIVEHLRQREKELSQRLNEGFTNMQKANVLGKCPKCGGDLIVKRSKKGSMFVSCSNWPRCDVAYPLPHTAKKIVPTGRVCELCHTPIVKVFLSNKKVFEMDLDPNCITKKEWGSSKNAAVPSSDQNLLGIEAMRASELEKTRETVPIAKKNMQKKVHKHAAKASKVSKASSEKNDAGD